MKLMMILYFRLKAIEQLSENVNTMTQWSVSVNIWLWCLLKPETHADKQTKQQLKKFFDMTSDSGRKIHYQVAQIYRTFQKKNLRWFIGDSQEVELSSDYISFIDYRKQIEIWFSLKEKKTYIHINSYPEERLKPKYSDLNIDQLVKDLEEYVKPPEGQDIQINFTEDQKQYKGIEGITWMLTFLVMNTEDKKQIEKNTHALKQQIYYIWKIYKLLKKNKCLLINSIFTRLHGFKFEVKEYFVSLEITNTISLLLNSYNYEAIFYKKENTSVNGNALNENWKKIYEEVYEWTSPWNQQQQQVPQQQQPRQTDLLKKLGVAFYVMCIWAMIYLLLKRKT